MLSQGLQEPSAELLDERPVPCLLRLPGCKLLESKLIIVANLILEWLPQHVGQSTDRAHVATVDTATG